MAKPFKHYGKWRIRWERWDRERGSETYATKAEADFALQRNLVEAYEVRKGLRPRPVVDPTFDELADYWLKHRASKKRSEKDDKSIIGNHFRPAFGPLLLPQVTTVRIDCFREGLEVSIKTEHNFLTLLISMFKLAVYELQWLSRAPYIKKPKISLNGNDYRWLRSKEEIHQLLKAARDRDFGTFVLYATAVYTGMRAGELAALMWEAVDLEKRIITVKGSFGGPTKSGDIRHVPILETKKQGCERLPPAIPPLRRRIPC